MKTTPQHTVKLAEEMLLCKPSSGWRTCLAIARQYHDPAKKTTHNIVGKYGMTQAQFFERLFERLFGAHIRHNHTNYDALLQNGLSKEEAREAVQPIIVQYLKDWSRQPN